MRAARPPLWMAVLPVALAALGAVYTAAGVHRLVADTPDSFPVDLRLRWMESRLLAEGKNTQRVGHPDPLLPETHAVMRGYGGSYPPWSYAFGLFFAPPVDWPIARVWFALLSLLAMTSVALDGWRRARGLGSLPATIAAVLVFTNFSAAICLSYGQYGVIVSGLMAAAVRLLEHGRGWTAGAMLGLALVKPQLAAPYCIAMAATRRWRAVTAIAATIAAGTVLMALAVGEPPLTVSSRAIHEMSHGHTVGNPLLVQLLSAVKREHAVVGLGLVGAGLIAGLASRHGRDPFTLACLSIVIAMFWTHRKHFDVALMSLPLIWLWIEAVRTKRPLYAAVFAATGLTLWLPLRDVQWELWWVGAAQLIVWPAAAVLMTRAKDPGR